MDDGGIDYLYYRVFRINFSLVRDSAKAEFTIYCLRVVELDQA